MPPAIPGDYARMFIQTFGEPGAAWLAALPGKLENWSRRWSLTLGEPFALSYNYVLPATLADGRRAVLKAGLPNPEFASEIAALRIYNGHGIVQLYEANIEEGVMLQERLYPGEMLSTLADDDQATRIAAEVIQKLWQPLTTEQAQPFPTLERWTNAIPRVRDLFPDRVGPFPAHLLDLAEGLRRDLLASSGEPVLLHGDLHHYNILSAEREPWLAIDPKGVLGERTFDICALMYNPWGMLERFPDLPRQMTRRAAILSETLGIDRQRILNWAFTGMVLSICWSYEEHKPTWANELPIAEALRAAAGYD